MISEENLPEPSGFEEERTEGSEEEEHDDFPRSVASSMVAEWGYDRESETIEVTFNNGHQDSYPCSASQWEEAKNSPSPGRWMHQNVL